MPYHLNLQVVIASTYQLFFGFIQASCIPKRFPSRHVQIFEQGVQNFEQLL